MAFQALIIFTFLAVLVKSSVKIIYLTDFVDSESARITCGQKSYCDNTTEFTVVGDCINPELTISFIITDFDDPTSEYVAIKVNEIELGFCTGPPLYANYTSDEIGKKGANFDYYLHDSYYCIKNLSILELTQTNPSAVHVKS